MSYFLIFLAVVVIAAAAFYVVGLNKPGAMADIYQDAMAQPVANLPPVLLPKAPVPADVDRLRLSLGLRGYRMDQVDEVLDHLRDELAAKDLRIAELEAGAPYTEAPEAEAPDTEAPDTGAASRER
ncbi:DivIVA domain-containing protein [Arthrobacter sp. TMP15]|uniref:DivIVA domain-containing protein n=1 Tax=Arthrobacter sp. TMP15 TaxID=3140789 RepID=UPI0031BA8EAB